MKKMSSYLAVLLAFLMSFSLTACTNGDGDTQVATQNEINVSIEIDCSEILKHYDDLDDGLKDEKYVPENGIILDKTEITVDKDSSATEILQCVAEEFDIPVLIESGYAKSINYVSEKSCGPMSGWVYEVNNEMVMDEYHASEGDLITWKFICSFD